MVEVTYKIGIKILAFFQVDFAGDVGTAIKEINDFVYNATNGTIEEAVGSDSVDSSTKLVLVSTLFFNVCCYLNFF